MGRGQITQVLVGYINTFGIYSKSSEKPLKGFKQEREGEIDGGLEGDVYKTDIKLVDCSGE